MLYKGGYWIVEGLKSWRGHSHSGYFVGEFWNSLWSLRTFIAHYSTRLKGSEGRRAGWLNIIAYLQQLHCSRTFLRFKSVKKVAPVEVNLTKMYFNNEFFDSSNYIFLRAFRNPTLLLDAVLHMTSVPEQNRNGRHAGGCWELGRDGFSIFLSTF